MSNLLKTDNMWLNLHCKGGLSIKHYLNVINIRNV